MHQSRLYVHVSVNKPLEQIVLLTSSDFLYRERFLEKDITGNDSLFHLRSWMVQTQDLQTTSCDFRYQHRWPLAMLAAPNEQNRPLFADKDTNDFYLEKHDGNGQVSIGFCWKTDQEFESTKIL
uniref:Uncharacterized protein n=1 Tax=Populus alba TaxID=43335 RepID=A0A4U5N7U2_POPAL|nr:hypothetical protein D5086_0000276880 [Populus alba]